MDSFKVGGGAYLYGYIWCSEEGGHSLLRICRTICNHTNATTKTEPAVV